MMKGYKIKNDWNSIVKVLELKGPALQLAAHCEFGNFNPKTKILVLKLDADMRLICTKSVLEKFRQSFSDFYGERVNVGVKFIEQV